MKIQRGLTIKLNLFFGDKNNFQGHDGSGHVLNLLNKRGSRGAARAAKSLRWSV